MPRLLGALALLLLALGARAQAPAVQLRLAGTVGAAAVADEACFVRFLPAAQPGFDANDASKLFPPSATYALVATRIANGDGSPRYLAVNSLPDGSPGGLTRPVAVPVAVITSAAGSFTIAATGTAALPPAWRAILRDLDTGAEANLTAGQALAFSTTSGGDWQDRFLLVVAPAGVAVATDLADVPGWRLLSAPVGGLTVTDLAGINLVQGVAAGEPASAFPAQYAAEAPNLFTGYTGTAFTPPATTADGLEPGRGFFWQWYDAAFGPFAGGTSASRDLREFALGAAGPAATADVTRTFARTPDGFLLAGNPFAGTFALDGLAAAGGTLAGAVHLWDPNGATYRLRFGSNPDTGLPDAVGPWQGFFAEVVGTPEGTDPALTYAVAASTPGEGPLVGRTPGGAPAAAPDAGVVRLRLAGTLASGAAVADEAAVVRLRSDARAGADPFDAGKLGGAPGAGHALVAPVEAGGARRGVLALPDAPAALALAFTSTDAGTFTLAADVRLPDGWAATLRDVQTGAVADLRAGEALAFSAAAGGWAERFELVVGTPVGTAPAPPAAWTLSPLAPNPAAGTARMRLRAAEAGPVRAVVLDALGRTVAVAFDGAVAAGADVEIAVDTRGLAPGAYAVRVAGGAGGAAVETRRLVVAR